MSDAGSVNELSNLRPEREAYYERMAEYDLSPLWEVNRRLVTPEPVIDAVPHLWDYQEIRSGLLESGELITTKEAQRRVLILENPGLDNSHRIVDSMFAGLQLIMPGEIAPAHRHSPAALRFIMEGHGAYTAVGGERSYMEPGDFIITPAWAWHDHGHEGEGPVVWMDGLDIPMVAAFGPLFFEVYDGDQAPDTVPPGDSQARYGANMRPVGESWDKLESPIFNYPYARSRDALEQMREASDWDPCFGLKMQYVDPTTGHSAMPTLSTFLQLLPKGFKGETWRTTEGVVYSVTEGSGRVHVTNGEKTTAMDWKEKDIFCVPCWMPHRLESDGDAVLFSYSDRTAQEHLGIWREIKGTA
ncbi:MAG: gentisate 1,2-dioxygenase [Rhodospirillaceae bacterium]|jgi:gentisate 1,2-dioxygenase|nr:gentisate 1,2-dioxygenase [Rhodospirillaceae bacterium]MBT5457295.1 gentisate 1,2-dioxygenase [Rhodospirillaceae bacterium]